MKERIGTVYLVGAGPGDPGLLTLRAAELLSRADAVVYDRLIHPDVLRRARRGARLMFVGKEGGGQQIPQSEILELLMAQARLGRQVVRLKGGDPFVFGRGGEEALGLAAAGIPFEVVPGVSSGFAAPGSAAIPVTHRGLSANVTFATAQMASGEPDWPHLARAGTLVLFMAGQRLEHSARALIAAGRDPATPAAVVEAGTWEHERVLVGVLEGIAARAKESGVGSPSLLVVGEVVSLRNTLAALQRRAEPSSSGGIRRSTR